MMVRVCVGSSCHLRGAAEVVKKFQDISESDNSIEINLEACFCQDRCKEGVVIAIDEKIYTKVKAEDVDKLIERHKGGAENEKYNFNKTSRL